MAFTRVQSPVLSLTRRRNGEWLWISGVNRPKILRSCSTVSLSPVSRLHPGLALNCAPTPSSSAECRSQDRRSRRLVKYPLQATDPVLSATDRDWLQSADRSSYKS